MEEGVIILLLLTLQGAVCQTNFYGDSFSLMSPEKKEDGTHQMIFYHRRIGRGSCDERTTFVCDGAECSFETEAQKVENVDRGQWCQSETRTVATVSTKQTSFSLKGTGCCWQTNVEAKTTWTSVAELNLGTRSDTQGLNSCPVSTTVSSLRVPQNCFTKFRLLAHDPDRDKVKCRFTKDTVVPINFSLDETTCTLTSTGSLSLGVHVFEVTLEDFPSDSITLTYADGSTAFLDVKKEDLTPLCKVKLQFSLEIIASIPNCELGHVLPVFLSKTPSFDEVLYASVGQEFTLFAEAQASHASITEFQVSGPHGIKGQLKKEDFGKVSTTQTWTPQESDFDRYVPICFTAEATDAQSEMRCVSVLVTKATIVQGKAAVQCAPNKMTVLLEKASMPGIDVNFLKLRDPSCSLSSNDTHIMGTMSFSACGTKMEDKGDFIVFLNEINSFELPNEVIIRRESVRIGFSCKFPKTISISSYFSLHKSDYIFTESNFGSFGYTFEIFRDANFSDKVPAKAYPVEVKLLQTIYMGIQAQSELSGVKLFVETCKATPSEDAESSIYYNLLENGCIKDETFKVYKSDPTSFNFEVQAFKFSGNYDQVYITCSVILCESTSPFSRCAKGCLKEPSRRRRRSALSSETDRHSITQGPLLFVGQALPEAEGDENDAVVVNSDPHNVVMINSTPGVETNVVTPDVKIDRPVEVTPPPLPKETRSSQEDWNIRQMLNTNISTVFFATAFLIALVVMAAIICHFNKKRKAEDRKSLIAQSWN